MITKQNFLKIFIIQFNSHIFMQEKPYNVIYILINTKYLLGNNCPTVALKIIKQSFNHIKRNQDVKKN